MPAPAHTVSLCEGSLSNLQLFAEMGDLAGLRASLLEHAKRFADVEVDEFSRRLDLLHKNYEDMAELEAEHGEGACLQLQHLVVRELIDMGDRRFTPSVLRNAERRLYTVGSKLSSSTAAPSASSSGTRTGLRDCRCATSASLYKDVY